MGAFDDDETQPLRNLEGHALSKESQKRQCKITVAVAVGLLVAVGATLGIVIGVERSAAQSATLDARITGENVAVHLNNLQKIANVNSGSRAILLGYNASADYILQSLAETDYAITRNYFDMYVWAQNFSQFGTLDTPAAFAGMFVPVRNSGSGICENCTAMQPNNALGCNDSDYANFTGKIALVQRGQCTFQEKAIAARKAGAVATLVYDPSVTGLASGSISAGGDNPLVLAITYGLAQTLMQLSEGLSLHVSVSNQAATTFSIIAETPAGSADSVIVFGSHLDSVVAGPGINDNGSGTSANLEIALQWFRSGKQAVNKIRFCWWAAEEYGLLGSTAYVHTLMSIPKALDQVALNLNFDMLASPNYARGVYNGAGASSTVYNGSVYLQKLFTSYFLSQELPIKYTDFNGRSDYGPFISNGIPAGGLATGAEGLKTMQERDIFGGLANAQYDTCYHQSCDTIANFDLTVLGQNAKAAAFVVNTLAIDPNLRQNLNNKRPSEMFSGRDLAHTQIDSGADRAYYHLGDVM